MNGQDFEKIERLYHQALSKLPGQRAEFLREVCGENESLRQQVEQLLSAHDKASDFLNPSMNAQAILNLPSVSRNLSGAKLGHYHILSPLGKGGMGEVWLAQDIKLGRKIALKFLPAELTGNKERLRRFEQEARTTSALNHPNIITLHDIGEATMNSEFHHFIVTEFIDGQTLRDKMRDNPLPIAETIAIGIQIASALEAAHEAGVIHRDLKPENVMVRRDGIVKVLDFGLAKATESTPIQFDSQAPTLARIETEAGAVFGTARYMSPEQARGEKLDVRTDIFSLGVMLYEMIAGKPPFSGVNMIDVLAAILEREPEPLRQSIADLPGEFERIISKALRKTREQRYQSIKEMLNDLSNLKEDLRVSVKFERQSDKTKPISPIVIEPSKVSASSIYKPRFSRVELSAMLIGLSLIAAALWWFSKKPGESNSMRSTKKIEIANWPSAPNEIYAYGSFSKDGRMIAYAANQTGAEGERSGRSIWLKQKNSQSRAVQVTQDEFENDNPIWSPSGEEIAYRSLRNNQTGIWQVPYLGGEPELIQFINSAGVNLKFWSNDGSTIYYELKRNIFALNVKTKKSAKMTDLDPEKVLPYCVNISPDGQKVAFITVEKDNQYILWLDSVNGRSPRQLASLPGPGKRVIWHKNGNRILYSAYLDGYFQIFSVSIDGRQPEQITVGETNCFVQDIASDGSEILYSSSKEDSVLWAVNISQIRERSTISNINFNLWPVVSPDGKTLAFQAINNVSQGDKLFSGSIMLCSINQAGIEVDQKQITTNAFMPTWSPDGKQLAFMRWSGGKFSLWTIMIDSRKEILLKASGVFPVEYTIFPYNRLETAYLSWSPDSSKVAYVSDENGNMNIRTVMPHSLTDLQLTSNVDSETEIFCPLWASSGNRLAYTSRQKKEGKLSYEIHVIDSETKISRSVRGSHSFLRLLGWSEMDKELIFAVAPNENASLPADIEIVQVSVETGDQRVIKKLKAAYPHNIHLSKNGKMVAFTSHRDGRDDLWIAPVTGNEIKKLTANNDPRLYFSSLAWSPDGQTICFGKQSRYSLLSMLTTSHFINSPSED